MKKTGKYLWQLLIFIIAVFFTQMPWVSPAVAAQVRVQASLDRNQMGIGDSFILTVQISSDEDFDLPELALPPLQSIEVVNIYPPTRQSATSMSIVNGKTQFVQTVSQEFNYVLSPQKEGQLTIPGIRIVINGQEYKTNSLSIDVQEEYRAGVAPPKGRPRFPPGYGSGGGAPNEAVTDPEDLFEQLLRQQQQMFGGGGVFGRPVPGEPPEPPPSRQMEINTREAFFVHLDVDKTEVYEGEQITANWYIYTRASIESLDRAKFPDLKGFWKEIIEEVPALTFTDEIVNGVPYRKALLASHALFPIKAGTAVIDEFRIKAKVRMPTRFGWGTRNEYTKSSKRTPIRVLPLPTEGKTSSFSGAVGNYQISLKTEGTTFPANQPFSVKVRYEGMGNAKLIDLPQISWPDGLEVYDTKQESRFFKEGNSFKEFEILVIPRKEGAMRLPPLDLTYFDPAQKKYITQSTEELLLEITPGAAGSRQSSGGGAAAGSATDLQKSARPVLEWPEAHVFPVPKLWLYLCAFLLIVGYPLFQYIRQTRETGAGQSFSEQVHSKLKVIEQFVEKNEHRNVGIESTNLLYLLTAYLAGHKKADLEMHLLVREISLRDQQQFVEKINTLFDYFQLLGFSPDEVMLSTLQKTPVKMQIEELRKIAKEIVDKSKKEDNYNV